MTASIPTFLLNTGDRLPVIGYGTFGGKNSSEAMYEAAKEALKVGYRFFDTAYSYTTEEALGKAIRESDVSRKELFVNTKLSQTFHEPKYVRPACERSLSLLGLDYLDMYMVHWPLAWKFSGFEFENLRKKDEEGDIKCIDVPLIDTWRGMEQLVKDGLVKNLGISNFTLPMIKELLTQCNIPPAVHQIEIHPNLLQEDMLAFCKENNILCIASTPLGNPGLFGAGKINPLAEPEVLQVAKKYGKTSAQVVLNWGISRGCSVIPKSATPKRIKENFVVFPIDSKDVDLISKIGHRNTIRVCDPFDAFGPSNDVFGEHKEEVAKWLSLRKTVNNLKSNI
ncbi:NADP-dependent oxidoreductase domain-containing protein [Phycomyces blakesleeanus]